MSYYFIPVGTRCAANEVSQYLVSQPRFPFDWVQMNPLSMKKIIELEKESIRLFWQCYFSELDETKHHRSTQSWFPHDLFSSDEEINKTIDKYIRRTERLVNALDSSEKKIFYIMFGFPELNSYETVKILYNALKLRTKGNCYFIICNAMMSDDVETEDMYFFYEKLENTSDIDDNNWKDLVKKASNKVKAILDKKNMTLKAYHEETQ